jgi:hypothetical protein
VNKNASGKMKFMVGNIGTEIYDNFKKKKTTLFAFGKYSYFQSKHTWDMTFRFECRFQI